MSFKVRVGDLVMNKWGQLGMVTEMPSPDGSLGAYVEWYPYSPKAGRINYSIDKTQEFRTNYEFYIETERRKNCGGW